MFSTSDTFRFPFAVYDNGASPRALANADSAPSATLVVNGSDVGTSVTVTNPATGRYIASVSLSGLSANDVFWLRVSVTKTPTSGSATTELVYSQTARINAAIPSVTVADDGITANSIANGAITGAKIATDAITNAKISDGAITLAKTSGIFGTNFETVMWANGQSVGTSTFASGGNVTVTAIGNNVITGDALAASAVSEIQSGLATQSDINALNQSAARRIVLVVSPQMERPESGSANFQVEIRTYDADGAATNADSTPTISVTGIVTGDLSANLGAVTNPATGVYRATYNLESGDTVEQARFDASATIASSTFTISALSVICDFVAATLSTTHLQMIVDTFDNSELILADTNELQTDWANDGRLDVILDARASATALQTVDDNVDAIKGIVVDQLATMIVAGPGTYRFTESSGVLFLAPVKTMTDNLPSIPIAYSDVNGEAQLWVLNGSGNAIPTKEQIDTELSSAHGDGSWESGESATAEDIWTHDDRTLTSFPPSIELLFPQPGIGAFIPGADSEGWPRTLTINAIAGTTIVVLARVVYTDGTYLTQADVSAATSQIVDPDASSQETPVSLTVSQIIYDTLQMDGQWSEDAVGYNLRVVIAGTRIPSANKLYTANVSLTTATGPIKLAWSIQT